MQAIHPGVRAYAIYTFIRQVIEQTTTGPRTVRLHRGAWYNCYGKFIWGGDIPIRPGEKPLHLGIVDLRSLELTQLGCCPPALMKDFVMQEGGEMVEKDPVLEAMKLHERGYFGGGG